MPSINSENSLERLNYFNGQRLEADDLRLEQEYHIEMRRRLNQALYTPGIASNLEVKPDPENVHQVIVKPGVALDTFGREVILLDETKVPVNGLPNSNSAWTRGNYLYIEYAEEKAANINDGCNLTKSNNDIAWGGPSRIRTTPKLAFADRWPNESEGPIILAQVELDPSCAVAQIHNNVRKYVDAAKSTTRMISLEGETDIAYKNPKILKFHITGGPAKSVRLYLWADKFTDLYYTEIGAHQHGIPELTTKETVTDSAEVLDHTHTIDISELSVLEVGSDHGAKHDIKFPGNRSDGSDISDRDAINLGDNADDFKMFSDLHMENGKQGEIIGGEHMHDLNLPGENGIVGSGPPDATLSTGTHHHVTEVNTTEQTGQGVPFDETRTTRLEYFENLHVFLDGENITENILSQTGLNELGDGNVNHPFVKDGSGLIELDRIRSLTEGEHTLRFRVKNGNESGGKLRYNLYVE